MLVVTVFVMGAWSATRRRLAVAPQGASGPGGPPIDPDRHRARKA